jgi:hypothetical protein
MQIAKEVRLREEFVTVVESVSNRDWTFAAYA